MRIASLYLHPTSGHRRRARRTAGPGRRPPAPHPHRARQPRVRRPAPARDHGGRGGHVRPRGGARDLVAHLRRRRPWPTPASCSTRTGRRPRSPTARSARCRPANVSGCCWPGPCGATRASCCSTSRPRASTSAPARTWSRGSPASPPTPTTPPTVLVTHHVEEIPPGFTHALLLREGRVVAAGPLDEVLTAPALSDVFGLPLVLDRRDGRFAARADGGTTSAAPARRARLRPGASASATSASRRGRERVISSASRRSTSGPTRRAAVVQVHAGGGCRPRSRPPSPRAPTANGGGRRARPARSAPDPARATVRTMRRRFDRAQRPQPAPQVHRPGRARVVGGARRRRPPRGTMSSHCGYRARSSTHTNSSSGAHGASRSAVTSTPGSWHPPTGCAQRGGCGAARRRHARHGSAGPGTPGAIATSTPSSSRTVASSPVHSLLTPRDDPAGRSSAVSG